MRFTALRFGALALLATPAFVACGSSEDPEDPSGPTCRSNRDCAAEPGTPVCDVEGIYGEPGACVATSSLHTEVIEYDFGRRPLGSDATAAFAVRNTGTTVIGPLQVALEDADVAFDVVGNTCVDYLGAGATCTVRVGFSGQTPGSSAARLVVAGREAMVAVDLRAVATARLVVVPLDDPGPTLTSEPEGISCGTRCAAEFDVATVVLRAPDGAFATEWAGCAAIDNQSCTVVLDRAETEVGVRFAPTSALWGFDIPSASEPRVAISGDGYVYVAAGNRLLSFTADGIEAWSATTDFESVARIAADSAGAVVVLGTRDGFDIVVGKFAGDGNPLWERREPGAGVAGDFRISGLRVDGDDSIYVAGTVPAGDGNTDAWLRKYDRDGAVAWTRTHEGPVRGHDESLGIALDPAGEILWSIRESVSASGVAFLGKRYDLDGAFVANAEGPRWGEFAFDATGNLYQSGLTGSVDGRYAIYVSKGVPGGPRAWRREFGLTDRYYYTEPVVAVADSGVAGVSTVVVASRITGPNGNSDVAIRHFADDGTAILETTFIGPDTEDDRATSIAMSDDLPLFVVVGLQAEQGNTRGWLRAYR